jgi:hypothetical protein
MGWDIHAVLEYRRGSVELRSGPGAFRWGELAAGEVALCAGQDVVRALVGFPDGPIPARGLPPDCGTAVLGLYYRAVENERGSLFRHCRNKYTLAEAERVVARGEGRFTPLGDNPKALIADPDHFMPGWLTLPEVEHALLAHEVPAELVMAEFRAVLAAMGVLAQQYGPDNVRLVFWLTS